MKSDAALEVSRRDFLGTIAGALSAVALVIVADDAVYIASGAEPGAPLPAGGYDPDKHSYVYVIDITKCIGCGSCVRACKAENNVPDLFFRTWIERYMVSRSGEVSVDSPKGGYDGFDPSITGDEITKAFFVPKMCNHCSHSPCVQLCPVGASYRSPDGVVLVDEKRCIGCGYCVQACPYGSRFLNPETKVASKCTWCYHRITKGMRPACVEMCPRGVRKFGDAKALHDEVSEIIATKQVHVLKPELLTEPNLHYLGLSMEVR
ncbi:MAG: 4Fe-4S dicluster domain-containing protein [Candidatus Hydrogenedentes bacterium]|nr:4Fe-4S dicluster domain-containing protein [Candidatus Hydrogenedentota bacterium]